jgi:BirA family biotin operon repressor/biotin-[acetyl-CoA-carboxylase] ligase
MDRIPDLPGLYELVVCDMVDSAVAEARRLASDGADEGTLVWAQAQTAACDRFGRSRPSPRGNLYGCLVLRPEYPVAAALQLNYIAVVSLGLTVAELVSPMTGLRYRWPNAVLLGDAVVGDVVLEPGPTPAGTFESLLVGLTVNVTHSPEFSVSGETSLAAEGFDTVTAPEILEGFSRHFLSWINRWADAGFSPVRKAWVQRADGFGQVQEIFLKEETLTGRPVELDEHGVLVLESPDGIRRRLSVSDYFGIREG